MTACPALTGALVRVRCVHDDFNFERSGPGGARCMLYLKLVREKHG